MRGRRTAQGSHCCMRACHAGRAGVLYQCRTSVQDRRARAAC
jgi:hypothetical protein